MHPYNGQAHHARHSPRRAAGSDRPGIAATAGARTLADAITFGTAARTPVCHYAPEFPRCHALTAGRRWRDIAAVGRPVAAACYAFPPAVRPLAGGAAASQRPLYGVRGMVSAGQ